MNSNRESVRLALSRRDFLRLAGLAGGAALLAACGAPATPEAQPTEAVAEPTEVAEEPAPAVEEVTISWWNQFSTPTCQETFPKVIEEFEETYPEITVEYEISGGAPGGGEYIEVLLARIAAGNPPDTATLWSPPSQFGARGSLTSIDEMMDMAKWANPDAFYSSPLKSCQWRGKTYGLPASAGAGCIFINTAKFEEQGISPTREDFPTTWDGLTALSEKFVVWEGDELQQVGYVPWASGWLNPMWSALNGGQLYDAETTEYQIDSEQNAEWLDYWVKWLDDQYGGDIEEMNIYGNWYGDVYADGAFQLEQSAMDTSGSWGCTDAEIPFEWEVVKFPVGPSGSKSTTGFWPNWFVMPVGAPNPNEAFLLCEWFCTQGWVTWYKQVMDTPAWKDFPEGVLTESLVEAVGLERGQDTHDFFADYLEDAVEMWTSPIEDFASDTLNAAIDEVLHKTKTSGEALAEAQELCQAKLDETLQGL